MTAPNPYGAPPPASIPPQGYAPPPPRSGFPWGVILLIGGLIFGFFALMLIVAAIGFSTFLARSKAAAIPHAVAVASTPAFRERYQTQTGLVAAHYPSDFAAKNLDGSTVLLSRNLGGGEDEAVLIAGVPDPISDDVNEFARVLLVANRTHVESNGATYAELARHASDCLPGERGLLVKSSATYPDGKVLEMSTCFFMHSGHGYELKSIVSSRMAASELPLLEHILQETELTD